MGKLQHFVSRSYLRPWATDEKIHCLQDGRFFKPNIRNVGAENYFYRLRELSPEDVVFLREALINDSPAGLKASHEELINAFTLPYRLKSELKELGIENTEAMAVIDRMIIQLNEDFHTNIEQDFQPYLAAMISGSLEFLADAKETATFYRGLSVQYARTNHIKQSRLIMNPERLALYQRVANPLVHILSINVGLSLYAERSRHTVMLVDNFTAVPFVTGDQPVINIATGPRDTDTPARFELYYPVSPTRAMLLLEPSSEFLPSASSVSETFVHLYNLRMAAHSYRQVFSNSLQPLESIRDNLTAYLSCFPAKD
jgi:hypothetical protein